ncbi:hypothetical protein SD71_06115 [Cohnella kolymensis]|uniref:Phage protein n=1 Tax=Cohnella kolymensis TaxID=1590652 RepID=A0ABR5A6Q5_9BACL|nr:hypothetical protein [Cohnella kolymensis]KIL36734.1 hypothetical protein SD71_06115 [Cohnella kolymensis]
MLSFEEKIAVMDSFPELQRKDVSLGRVNYHYEQSAFDKKMVGFHFHPNGNGFIFAGRFEGYETDDKGFVNVRDYNAEQLRTLVAESIRSLTGEASPELQDGEEENWTGPNGSSLSVKYEDDMWYIFAGLNLDAAFETYQEAFDYLKEEGFTRK